MERPRHRQLREREDGRELLARARGGGGFYASPVIAGQHVYCPSREGDMMVLSAGKKYEHVARIPLGEDTHATPALAGGRMFIRTLTRVMCLQGR